MNKSIFLALILILLSVPALFSQEIKVNKVTIAKNDISAREYEILDANGDASALIKLRIDFKDLNFTTNLGINKTEERAGEIWLWVPPGTSSLLIVRNSRDSVLVKLPTGLEEYSVCVVLFTLILEKDVQTINLPSLTFNTDPQNANVYINDLYQGRSPITLSMMPDSFQYKIEKKHFRPVSGQNILSSEGKVIDCKLPSKSRLFLQLNSDFIIPSAKNLGFTIGIVGETGIYLTGVVPIKSIKNDFTITSTWQGLNFENFYLLPAEPKIVLISHEYFVIGVTQTVFHKLMLSAGFAYGRSELYQSYHAVYYSNNIPSADLVVLREDKSNKSGGFDLGVSYWYKNRILISLNNTSFINTKMLHDEFGNQLIGGKAILISDLKVGIGYSF